MPHCHYTKILLALQALTDQSTIQSAHNEHITASAIDEHGKWVLRKMGAMHGMCDLGMCGSVGFVGLPRSIATVTRKEDGDCR